MNFKNTPNYLLLSLALCGALHAGEHRQEGVHEHGVARLDLAQERNQIHLHFESPAMNLLGYEHMPSNDADRQLLEETLVKLRAADQIFRFNEQAACRLVEADVATPLADKSGPMSAEHDAHEESHDNENDHDDKHHADISANYRFECTSPEKLSQMRLDLFRLFPTTRALLIQYSTDKRQGGAKLTAENAELNL